MDSVCNIQLNHNINEVVSCVEDGTLVGLPGYSASPTDIFLFSFKPNTFYGTEPVKYGFMKIFVANPTKFDSSLYETFDEEVKALEYEISVYERTAKLVKNNVIGHFVKYFTSLRIPTSFENLKMFISDKAGIDPVTAGINLERNTISMIYPQDDSRPSITNPKTVKTSPLSLTNADKLLVRYKFILTEAVMSYKIPDEDIISKLQNFYNMPILKSVKLSQVNNFLKEVNCSVQIKGCEFLFNTLLEIYFQLAITTYAMTINNFVHNDLHDGNVWIKKTTMPVRIKYNLINVAGSPSYTINDCRYFSMIYDYDRAYKNKLDNPLLVNAIRLKDANQTNELIEQRDFVKVLCYMIHNLLPTTVKGTVKKYRLLDEDNIKMKLYYELLNCICRDNTKGFKTLPNRSDQVWQADRIKWPNEIDRYRDFWDRIFNNLEIYEVGTSKETNRDYICFLNRTGGKVDSITGISTFMQLNHLEPELYKETLYTMPEIIENLYELINKYKPDKIEKNDTGSAYYDYDVRQIV